MLRFSVDIVPENISKHSKKFETRIHNLVTCSDCTLFSSIFPTLRYVWVLVLVVALIASINFNAFIVTKLALQFVSENSGVVCSCIIRAINPNNL